MDCGVIIPHPLFLREGGGGTTACTSTGIYTPNFSRKKKESVVENFDKITKSIQVILIVVKISP